MSGGITTHVLDTSRGRPASGVPVVLEQLGADGVWLERGRGATDDDGRLKGLSSAPLSAGRFRITFDTAAYFAAQGVEGFYPEVRVDFVVRDANAHHHVPLLLNPYGYSTYRGS